MKYLVVLSFALLLVLVSGSFAQQANDVPANDKETDLALARSEKTSTDTPAEKKDNAGYQTKNPKTGENILKSLGGLPKEYKLHPTFPDLTGSIVPLRFDIPGSSAQKVAVELSIYNNLGQKIKTVFSGDLAAGSYEVLWQADDENGLRAGSGAYYALFKTEFFQQILKVTLTE